MTIYEIFKKVNGQKGERITSTESLQDVENLKEKFQDKIMIEAWKITEKISHNMGEV